MIAKEPFGSNLLLCSVTATLTSAPNSVQTFCPGTLGGVLALYGLLRLATGRGVAFVEALTYAVDPLYLGLSCTFMTDIPFTALLVSASCVALGLNSGRDRAIWLGLALAFVALFIRQLARWPSSSSSWSPRR